MKFLFRLSAALLTVGVLSIVGGAVGLILMLLLPVALALGGGLLAALVLFCVLALLF